MFRVRLVLSDQFYCFVLLLCPCARTGVLFFGGVDRLVVVVGVYDWSVLMIICAVGWTDRSLLQGSVIGRCRKGWRWLEPRLLSVVGRSFDFCNAG